MKELFMRKKVFILILLVAISFLAFSENDEKMVEKRGMTLKWNVENELLAVTITAPTTGWLGVGFAADNKMKGANIIIGYYKDGEVFIRDDFGTTPVAHKADTALGGVSNITEVSGSEVEGETTLSFKIPLDSGDDSDKVLVPGKEIVVIFAYGKNGKDDFKSYHAMRTTLKIEL
jgi:hypothetical protein